MRTERGTIWREFAWLAALALLSSPNAQAQTVLLVKGGKTEWRYKDDGKVIAGWQAADFDDGDWKKGAAPLGYGEENLGTTISYGSNDSSKHITTYFRTTFEAAEEKVGAFEKIGIRIRRDDGAVVYLNGEEVVRTNMPAGDVSETTLATNPLGTSTEVEENLTLISPEGLKGGGTQTIAVELHQADRRSSDAYLDLSVLGYTKSELPKQDFFRDGLLAARGGDLNMAADLLKQVPPDHTNYSLAMSVLAQNVLAEGLGRGEEAIVYAKKAYEADPANRDVVRAFVKTHLASGVLFKKEAIARERPTKIKPEHEFLVTKLKWEDPSEKLPREQLERDLDYLEHLLVHCFAYLELRDVDYKAALDAVRLSLEGETSLNAFELRLSKLISLFCDGHASVGSDPRAIVPKGYAPFHAGSYQDRVYLMNREGDAFLDEAHPYVTGIDGKPIEDWIKVAGYAVVKESPQWYRSRALGRLELINYCRAELGLDQDEVIRLSLESEDKAKTKEREVKVSSRRSRMPRFPRGESRRLEGDVGYIRIPQMTSSRRFVAQLDRLMDGYKDTKGLVLDVRGNPGGSKTVLFTLLPYFIEPDGPMKIAEFTTYRESVELPMPSPNGYAMSDTSGQVLTSNRWTSEAQRTQVKAAIDAFTPEWDLAMEKFSRWHVLALESTENPEAYYYDKPLIVLIDSNSFSAADIFAGAFEGHPRTTLMGTASGGGNGKMEQYRLPNSGIRLVLCRSAKFRPNGKLYDGLGVAPDVKMEATPQDILGKSDTVLEAARKRLLGE